MTEAALDAHPRAAFVHGQVDVIDEHDGLIAAAPRYDRPPGRQRGTGS